MDSINSIPSEVSSFVGNPVHKIFFELLENPPPQEKKNNKQNKIVFKTKK